MCPNWVKYPESFNHFFNSDFAASCPKRRDKIRVKYCVQSIRKGTLIFYITINPSLPVFGKVPGGLV
jgi:hypothetical protein